MMLQNKITSPNGVPLFSPNSGALACRYPQPSTSRSLLSPKMPTPKNEIIEEPEETPGYAFYCDKCDHIDMKRSDFKIHKTVHEKPMIHDNAQNGLMYGAVQNQDVTTFKEETIESVNQNRNYSIPSLKDTSIYQTPMSSGNLIPQIKQKPTGPTARKKTAGIYRTFTKEVADSIPNIQPTIISLPEIKNTKKRELKAGEGILKLFKISEDMAAIIGKTDAGITRPNCLKELWAYLKTNNLQDPEHKQYFVPDKKMAKIFGSERMRAFSMSKFLTQHLLPLDETNTKVDQSEEANQKDSIAEKKKSEPPWGSEEIIQHMEPQESKNLKKDVDQEKLSVETEVNNEKPIVENAESEISNESKNDVKAKPSENVGMDSQIDKENNDQAQNDQEDTEQLEDQSLLSNDFNQDKINELEAGGESAKGDKEDKANISGDELSEMDTMMQLPLF